MLLIMFQISPTSPFYGNMVNKAHPDYDYHISALTFSKVLICSPVGSYIWLVTDRYGVVSDIDNNGLTDIPFTGANCCWPGRVFVAFQTSLNNFNCVAISNQHSVPYGVSVGDFNSDGKKDLVFTSAAEQKAFTLRNNGGWSFTEQQISAGTTYPNHIAIRDVDAGPGSEIIFTDEGYRLFKYNFITNSTQILNYECMEGLSVADLNSDGKQDIVCGTSNFVYGPGSVKFQLNLGNSWSSTYTIASGHYWHGITTGDFNKDGKMDVAACSADDDRIYIFRNNGGNPPTFTQVASVYVGSDLNECELTVADIDCDGDYDIIWARGWSGSGPSIGYLENPTWTNNVIETGTYITYGVAVSYINTDKKPDIVAGLNNQLYVYYNTSNIDTTLCLPITPVQNSETKNSISYKFDNNKLLINAPFNTKIDINIYSVNGRMLFSKNYNLNTGNNEILLNLKRGVYMIYIRNGDETKKFPIAIN
jgi:hypothetical protein